MTQQISWIVTTIILSLTLSHWLATSIAALPLGNAPLPPLIDPHQQLEFRFNYRRHQRDFLDSLDTILQGPTPTYIPPPKTDITSSLIEQSLAIQPQKNATVHSVIPYFGDGTISFQVQLDGPIPQSLSLNATDSLPCDGVGIGPDPNMMLVPRTVTDGTSEVTIPDCIIIAINKYNATWINYWVSKTDGSNAIHALLGDAKIHDIDQLDTGKPAALSIRAITPGGHFKREEAVTPSSSSLKRQQVFAISCAASCPYPNMLMTKGIGGMCGCTFFTASPSEMLPKRGLQPPNSSTATMSAAACAGMQCINNGNKPAIYNPFSRTCWCTAPMYVDNNPSAHQ